MAKTTKKIVAIGGGAIKFKRKRYDFATAQTTPIDKEIIKLSGQKNPTLCFIPTASMDSKSYTKIIKYHFGKSLGCKVKVLNLVTNPPSFDKIEKIIMGADIIYVGGGNTRMMIEFWHKLGVDKVLKRAYDGGKVMCGLSAGAICWFKFGNSDSNKIEFGKEKSMIKVSALGWIDAVLCPHYDAEAERKPSLKEMMKKEKKLKSIALDNCAAIEIIDDKFRVITSSKTAKCHLVYWDKDKFIEKDITSNKYQPLKNI
ncbi:MAG: peptidase E [Lactobacillus sp.]|jgi:dipeptidase E|nr:peptidase E [Lactobacillus sp.]